MKNITKFESFFSVELYQEIKNFVDLLFKEKSNKLITNLSWDEKLRNTSSLIARYEFLKEDMELCRKIQKEVEDKVPYFLYTNTLHILPNSSYITWHTDYSYNAALTVYLNDYWDDDWGGFLMYEEDNQINAIKPQKNLGILQENHVNHCVSTVNIGADYRVSLQIFLKDKKNII